MAARPLSLAVAVALLAVIGAGVAFIGFLLLAVATGAIAFLAGGIHGFVAVLGVVTLGSAAVTTAGAAGLWMRRGWAWTVSLIVAISVVIGALIAIDSAGTQTPILIGLAMGIATTTLLVAPPTRSAVGVA
jgi:hypothetical protein